MSASDDLSALFESLAQAESGMIEGQVVEPARARSHAESLRARWDAQFRAALASGEAGARALAGQVPPWSTLYGDDLERRIAERFGAPSPRKPRPALEHPTLGRLTWSEDRLIGQLAGELDLVVEVPDEADLDAQLAWAVKIVAGLESLRAHGEAALAKDLTDAYNGGWNVYDVQLDDGTTATVENPELSGSAFAAKFALRGVDVLAESCVTLHYDDPEELFWGHHVYVDFTDGLGAENASAAFAG